MKGTSFQKPLEFHLAVEGESWTQGETLAGTLGIKNQGTDPVYTASLQLHLAYGNLKKVRQRAPGALKILKSASFGESGELAPQEERKLSWSFTTDLNFPITDSSNSPFLLYGKEDAPEKLGQLQLIILPAPVIQEVIRALTIQFRFVLKAQKSGKGWVEFKLAPPDSRAFASVEQLILSARLEGEDLQLRYGFQVKSLDSTPAAFDVKKTKKELDQALSPSEYKVPSGRWNHERIEGSLREALSAVESKIVF